MRTRLLPTFTVLLAGGAQAASMAAPWNGQPQWWLQILSLAVLCWQLTRCAEQLTSWSSSTWSVAERRPDWQTGWKGAAWLGWVFATAWLAGTFWWLFISMHTYGGLPTVLAVLAVLGLAGVLALYYAVACAVFFKLFYAYSSARLSWSAIVFSALWTLAELARGVFFTGFPWGAGGYAHTGGPLAGYAPWVGVYGVGAVAAWAAFMLPGLLSGWRRDNWPAVLITAAVLALPVVAKLAGQTFTRSTGTQTVALLQGNIPQDEKFQPGTGVSDALRWYGAQLEGSRASLVVAPETAIPLLPQQLPAGYWAALQARFARGDQAALIGVPLGSNAEGYTNSTAGLKPGQAQDFRYDKHHLVPFGEFIPPYFKWFLAMMNIPLGDFNRGTLAPPSFEWRGQRLAPNICYEDLFGEELGARFVKEATAPTVMVNLSNIGWFGNTLAIDQHLQISRMRALEFERPMLRATNTGPTVIIDHRGEVKASLERHTRGVLEGVVDGRSGNTPFARWVSRLGLWPLWILSLLVVAVAAWVSRLRPH
jgi:apolipoprotein N-acyltransferase